MYCTCQSFKTFSIRVISHISVCRVRHRLPGLARHSSQHRPKSPSPVRLARLAGSGQRVPIYNVFICSNIFFSKLRNQGIKRRVAFYIFFGFDLPLLRLWWGRGRGTWSRGGYPADLSGSSRLSRTWKYYG